MSPFSSLHDLKPELADKIQARLPEIREWESKIAASAPPPFYSSVDLRDAGFKIVPVDCNIFPAGFNNICSEDLGNAPAFLKVQLELWAEAAGAHPAKKVLIVPEAHTQNKYYLENLSTLCGLIQRAGFETYLGWYDSTGELPADRPVELESFSGKKLKACPVSLKDDGTLVAGKFTPDLIIINNDFSTGYPEIFDGVRQPVSPSHRFGWHSRKKGAFFEIYNQLATEFAEIIDYDSWPLEIDTRSVSPVNFSTGEGIDRVAATTDALLSRVRDHYGKQGVEHEPFAFIKNESGTYGMGILVVHSGEELKTLNRREKNKMSFGKNKLPIDQVLIQEGVPSITRYEAIVAEPVMYLVGSELIGGFLRTHGEKTEEDNLNSPGMVFRKLCVSDLRKPMSEKNAPVLELVYGAVARLSALAAGLELKNTPKSHSTQPDLASRRRRGLGKENHGIPTR